MRQNRGSSCFSNLALPLTQIVMLALLLVNGEDNRLVNFISHSFFVLVCICICIVFVILLVHGEDNRLVSTSLQTLNICICICICICIKY